MAPKATAPAAGKKAASSKYDKKAKLALAGGDKKKKAAGAAAEEKKKAIIPQNHKEQHALKLERRRFENPDKFALIKEAKGAGGGGPRCFVFFSFI